MKEKVFSISVVVATYNSGKTLDECLKKVREQDYPQDEVEIILGDGGSKDSTLAIAKKYKAKVLSIPPQKQYSEYNRGVAFNAAKNELVLIIDHDNFLPSKNWLKQMIEPLQNHPEMVAVETCYYHYDRSYSVIDRYTSLFGTSEPLPYYLKKADRMPQTAKKWSLQGKAKDYGSYYLVTFEKDPRHIPSIGTNGCLMRREILLKYADVRPDHHYPIDVMVDVIKKGHNTFGFVKNSIIHLTGARGFWSYLVRRKKFVEEYHFQHLPNRRYSVVMKGDEKGLVLFVIYSLTFIKPLWDACAGFFVIPDPVWFLHPILCFGTTVIYSYVVLKSFVLKKLKK